MKKSKLRAKLGVGKATAAQVAKTTPKHILPVVLLAWSIISTIMALLGWWFDYVPKIDINAVQFDPQDPVATQFLISNPGRLSLERLHFSCSVFEGARLLVNSADNQLTESDGNIHGNMLAKELRPGKAIARDCAMRQSGGIKVTIPHPGALSIEFTVEYHWPVVGREEVLTRRFSVKTDASRHITLLLPDDI